MDASLNQPSSVQDDGPMGCKLLLRGDNTLHVLEVCRYRANKDRLIPYQQPRLYGRSGRYPDLLGLKGA